MEQEESRSSAHTVVRYVMVLLIGILIGMRLPSTSHLAQRLQSRQATDKLSRTVELIAEQYVDPIDADSVSTLAVKSLLPSLDPHSSYLSPKALQRETEQLRGQFQGIGVLLGQRNDTTCVRFVFPDSPARRAGLQTGDRIVAVDSVPVAGRGWALDTIIPFIKGPRHTDVRLTLHRYGQPEPMQVTVQRDNVAEHSVTGATLLEGGVGYIAVTSFIQTTHEEFVTAFRRLNDEAQAVGGLTHLILDLRENGGGLLGAATDLVDEFLPGRELIVYTKGAHQRRYEQRSHRGGLYIDGPLTVLIDENTASAAEIVTGALQDWDRATVLGRRSFGKGLVQHQFDLPGGAGLLLTVSRYYTPSGRCIQRPYADGTANYYLNHLARSYVDDSLSSDATGDTTTYLTASGRKVYGGGGITPDQVLTRTRDEHLVYYNELVETHVVEDYAYDYVTSHYTSLLDAYTDPQSFVRRFTPSDDMMRTLLQRADNKGLKRDEVTLIRYRHELQTLLKANLAFHLFGPDAYRAVQLQADEDITKTLQFIKQTQKRKP